MLNDQLGTVTTDAGRSHIITEAGRPGHAVYGDYVAYPVGDHVVEFTLSALGRPVAGRDPVCAIIDVAFEQGARWLAREEVRFSQLADGPFRLAIPFTVVETAAYECRVWTTGAVGLDIDGYRPVTSIPAGTADVPALVAADRFPAEEGRRNAFFRENEAMFRSLYEQGDKVAIVDGDPVLTIEGVAIHARSHEELIFVSEVLRERVYQFGIGRPTCAIDIGMNVGLTSLTFAARPEITEVHSFEPFPSTFDIARRNLGLNPALAAKITPYAYGLSDKDHDGEVAIDPAADIGARSTVGVAGGVPVTIRLRDAAAVLGPIIRDARARGLAIAVKVDCEGSEFAIFASLAQAGLLPLISILMVEWHAMFPGRTQEELIAPLRDAGFVVFDRSPPIGNGFFYAARIAAD